MLALIGGLLHAPNNFDGLAYRTPRILHWLAEGQWHWIADPRGWLNTRSVGFEWLTAPVLLFLKTDRPLFLISFVSFLLLPGLVFSLFHRLGIRKRTAWHWMWLLPTGLCFTLQAGSIANDLFGAILALAAIDFALRARVTRRPSELWFSIIAAGLMTAAKSSNLPLLLPWAIAIFPSWRLALARPAATVAVVALTGLASLLPTAILNYRHSGDWTGLAAENAFMRPPSPFVAAAHNAGLLVVQNLVPPIFPRASLWNHTLENALPERWKQVLDTFAEDGRRSYYVRELASEEFVGIGLVLTLLLLAQLIANDWRSSFKNRSQNAFNADNRWRTLLLISPFLALVGFMLKSGIGSASRLIAPYYALLLPLLLVISDGPRPIKRRWWKNLAWVAFLSAGLVVVLSPARPLFPARAVLSYLDNHTDWRIVERARSVYDTYRNRADACAPLRAAIPATAKSIGFVTGTDAETSLWRPIGSRRVHRVAREMTADDLAKRGVEFVVLDVAAVPHVLESSFDEWVTKMSGCIVTNMPLKLRASADAYRYAVVRLNHEPPQSSDQTAPPGGQ